MTYTGWSTCSLQSGVPADPRDWSLSDVKEWLRWTMVEFSLASDAFHRFIEDFKVSVLFHKIILFLGLKLKRRI